MKDYIVLHRCMIKGKYVDKDFIIPLSDDDAKGLKKGGLIKEHKEVAPTTKGKTVK